MEFDPILKDKVRHLLWYVDKLRRLEIELMLRGADLNADRYIFIHLSRAITNQLIYLIINEEISDISGRESLPKLYEQLWESEDTEDINRTFKENDDYFSYVKDLFVKEFNSILQAFFYDYSISMWSAFELSISHIFNEYSNGCKDEFNSSHLKKFEKFAKKEIISKLNIPESLMQEIKSSIDQSKNEFLKEFPRYITSDDKLNYIFKHLVKNSYTRNIKEDKEKLHFIRATRNTLHNNGIHTGRSISVVIRGYKYELKQGEYGKYGSDINIIGKYHELLDIYMHILFALPNQS